MGGVCLKISERNSLGLALPARPIGGNRSGKDDFKFFFGGKFFYLTPPSANNASDLYIPLLLALNSCLTCTNIFSSV